MFRTTQAPESRDEGYLFFELPQLLFNEANRNVDLQKSDMVSVRMEVQVSIAEEDLRARFLVLQQNALEWRGRRKAFSVGVSGIVLLLLGASVTFFSNLQYRVPFT